MCDCLGVVHLALPIQPIPIVRAAAAIVPKPAVVSSILGLCCGNLLAWWSGVVPLHHGHCWIAMGTAG